MSNTFLQNLNDFFSQPNFQDFSVMRKPSIDEGLLSFNNEGLTLDIDFLDPFPMRQPSFVNQLPLSEPDLHFEQVEFPDPAAVSSHHSPEDSAGEVTPSRQHRPAETGGNPRKKFYNKNSCRNIIRKAVRCIESGTYRNELELICEAAGQDYVEFCDVMIANFEEFTGPAALRKFLQPKDRIAMVFGKFLAWFLKERYIREALKEGHMKDLNKYIEYKNTELMPMLARLV